MREFKRMRPKMDAGYGVSTDEAGMLEWAWVDDKMTTARNYWIISTRKEGAPHAAPVWGVWIDGAFYWSTSTNAVKARNLLNNPQVVVHLESGDDVVILEGRAALIDQAKEVEMMKRITGAYAIKYDMPDAAEAFNGGLAFVLAPSVVMAWTESDFPKTAARFEFATAASNSA